MENNCQLNFRVQPGCGKGAAQNYPVGVLVACAALSLRLCLHLGPKAFSDLKRPKSNHTSYSMCNSVKYNKTIFYVYDGQCKSVSDIFLREISSLLVYRHSNT